MGYPCQELLAPKPWDLRWATPVKGRKEPGTETSCSETFRPANQICVWEHWGLTVGYPCQELLAPKPWDLRWATPVKGREEPGTETFCGETFRPANQICVWEHWGLTLLGQILGGGPLGTRFGHFAAFQLANEICFWKPSEEARRAKS